MRASNNGRHISRDEAIASSAEEGMYIFTEAKGEISDKADKVSPLEAATSGLRTGGTKVCGDKKLSQGQILIYSL